MLAARLRSLDTYHVKSETCFVDDNVWKDHLLSHHSNNCDQRTQNWCSMTTFGHRIICCEKKLKWFKWKISYATVDCGNNSGMLVIAFRLMGKQLQICIFDVHDMRIINLSYTNTCILASFFGFFPVKIKKSQYIDLLDLSYAVLLQIVKPLCPGKLTRTISPNSHHVQVYHCTSTVAIQSGIINRASSASPNEIKYQSWYHELIPFSFLSFVYTDVWLWMKF